MKGSHVRSHLLRHPASWGLLTGLAITGCGGHQKVQRSTQPVTVAARAPATARQTASGRFDGRDVVTKFGDVQVSLTLTHGHITDVQWLKLPSDRPRSAFISQNASPILRSEVLSAQSARIDLVSGATYTSDAWATSVQAALSRAH
jgi:uncharacterized protein with FMN-binding domain